MATLTGPQRAEISRRLSDTETVTETKPVYYAAIQAIEDWFEDNRAGISAAINTATAPVTLTGAQKKKLLIGFLLQKSRREDT